MPRKYYTEDEIVLCTYAAMYDAQDFGGIQMVCQLTGRSTGSISMKIRNIIAMLNANNITHANSAVGLTGSTTGLKARETNWDSVEPLIHLPKQQLLKKCMDILHPYQ